MSRWPNELEWALRRRRVVAHKPARPAFSLTELLIVISVIILLIMMTTAGLGWGARTGAFGRLWTAAARFWRRAAFLHYRRGRLVLPG